MQPPAGIEKLLQHLATEPDARPTFVQLHRQTLDRTADVTDALLDATRTVARWTATLPRRPVRDERPDQRLAAFRCDDRTDAGEVTDGNRPWVTADEVALYNRMHHRPVITVALCHALCTMAARGTLDDVDRLARTGPGTYDRVLAVDIVTAYHWLEQHRQTATQKVQLLVAPTTPPGLWPVLAHPSRWLDETLNNVRTAQDVRRLRHLMRRNRRRVQPESLGDLELDQIERLLETHRPPEEPPATDHWSTSRGRNDPVPGTGHADGSEPVSSSMSS